jgi:hypothetical protein
MVASMFVVCRRELDDAKILLRCRRPYDFFERGIIRRGQYLGGESTKYNTSLSHFESRKDISVGVMNGKMENCTNPPDFTVSRMLLITMTIKAVSTCQRVILS